MHVDKQIHLLSKCTFNCLCLSCLYYHVCTFLRDILLGHINLHLVKHVHAYTRCLTMLHTSEV